MKPDWRQSCVRLWGEDWVTPLADVLGVDRKTVTRWKMGETPIPSTVENDLIMLVRNNWSDDLVRIYGDLLRRIARGETDLDIDNWLNDNMAVLNAIRRDVGLFDSIPALAKDML